MRNCGYSAQKPPAKTIIINIDKKTNVLYNEYGKFYASL